MLMAKKIDWRVSRWDRRCAVGTAAVVLGLKMSVSRAVRAETPVVTIDPKTSPTAPSASIPISGGFVAKYVFESEVKAAALDVWPATLQNCEQGTPGAGSRQTYHLPFTLTTDAGKSTGTASVPHLQVAEPKASAVCQINPRRDAVGRTAGEDARISRPETVEGRRTKRLPTKRLPASRVRPVRSQCRES